MNKFIYAFSFLLLSTTASIAQQHRYALKIGLHAGLSNYYGDLSHQVWDLPHQFKQPIQDFNFLSYGLSVEYHVSRTFGLRLWGMKSQFKASDRAYEQNDRYHRALNVQTDLFDASLLGIVYFDNDMLLKSRSVVAPYFMFGGGLTHFETKGDLLSADNNRYHYWSDNSIRTEAETGLNAATAPIIEQDYEYETALRTLNTEGADYSPITWNVALGLGVKFRLSNRFHLHLEALVRYTGSDYLDDVSDNYRSSYNDNFQAYAANPSNANRSTRGETPEMNDWYTFVGLSAHYSFGQKTYKIRPSIIYTEDLLSNNNNLNTPTTPTNPKNNASPQAPRNTIGSDTLVQKITTTTTTIKTVTIDTVDNRSSSNDLKTSNTELLNLEPIPVEEVEKPATNNLAEVLVPNIENTSLDSTTWAVDSFVQNKVDSISNDSTGTFVEVPIIDKTAPIPLAADTIMEEKDSAAIVKTILNRSEENVASNDSTFIQNKIITNTKPTNTNQISALALQEQQYQYEMLLQKERYERQLAELRLQKDLEQERKKSPPNTKEQELQYQLKLEQQKLANELEKQKLLNQLEIEKNRPAPDTKEEELKWQQQKYEADLKLLQQEYEYKLQIQALQNQLNIEQLKKVNEGTGAINPPAPSNAKQPSSQDLNPSANPIDKQNKISNSSESRQADLIRMQLEQQELLLKIRTLEAAAAPSTTRATNSKDTIKIVQRDSIFIGNGNNEALTEQLNQQQRSNNSLTTKLAAATQKSLEQEQEIDRLQQEIAKIESEKKRVASKLDVFLTQKKGTYVTKIYFDVSKSNLTVQAKETLTTLVYYLEKYPTVQFWVKGFASKTGRTEVNERLSAERAAEVADFLKQSGIQNERIRTTPLGEQNSNSSNELDRRAEVHLSF